jgi:hypothetical protein
MKLLVIAADAAFPDYIIGKKQLFPNLRKLIENGATGEYSAYVQKGYNGSYSSEQNWASIYTGLTPSEHKIETRKYSVPPSKPCMSEFDGLKPFWQMLNNAGLSVGIWQGDCLNDPVAINGYIVSAYYAPIFTPTENREAPRTIQVSDECVLRFLKGNSPPRLYPPTLAQQGLTFEALKSDPALVSRIANEENFRPMLDNFEEELAYWFDAMTRAQREMPVDAVWWFTPTTDILPHFTLWCDDNPVLIRAYQMLDKYIGEYTDEFSPENIVFLSDHGQQNFKELTKCSDNNIRREAFKAHDKVIWLDNGYIAFEALNGGLLFTAHSLKGTFIASGKGIRRTEAKDMRTVDIYPTLLEMLEIQIPEGRSGYVADIFDRRAMNVDRVLKPESTRRKRISLVQTHDMSVTDIIINEIYNGARFAEITVVGEAKYEEIFRNNPRVSDFLPFEQFDATMFEEIYCGFYNETTKLMKHIRVK